eukprot:352625-Chlamydomonas_euryale.AAC.2
MADVQWLPAPFAWRRPATACGTLRLGQTDVINGGEDLQQPVAPCGWGRQTSSTVEGLEHISDGISVESSPDLQERHTRDTLKTPVRGTRVHTCPYFTLHRGLEEGGGKCGSFQDAFTACVLPAGERAFIARALPW